MKGEVQTEAAQPAEPEAQMDDDVGNW